MSDVSHALEFYAERNSCHPLTLRREIARGKLKAVRIGRQIRITESAWDAYIASQTLGARSGA